MLSGSYENFDRFWGRKDGKRVNWCGTLPSSPAPYAAKPSTGFYLHPSLFPSPKTPFSSSLAPPVLLLGPFQGRPACLEIALSSPSSRALGVCASAFLSRKTVVVPDVENHAGHIACDGVTRSEVVVPILVKGKDGVEVCVGVLDVDCEAPDAFGEEDRAGLEKVVQALNQLIAWGV